MADNMNFNQGGISFNFESKASQSIIKVIGVGGGGGNAVNHMYREGIHDVTYVLCNTDRKALSDSPIPNHLQLGKDGLGAGNRPEKARQAALESMDEIKEMLNDGTRMVFITAGMGGGTGTGAAPIIAQCAKDAGILTVGIVTIPFKFEGNKKINQALDGVEEISKHVDALLVINNERLREIYPELTVLTAFAKADDTLSIAAKSIAEIITMHGIMNLDFQDVTTVLKDGGVAIMSTGYGEGENRVTKAINEALNSPLLNNNDIFNIYKYDNTLYRVTVTGAELKRYMEWAAECYNQWLPGDINISFDPEYPGYLYDMFSGVDYDINLSKPKGQRIENVMFKGRPLQDDDVLTLAVNNYRYSSCLKANHFVEAKRDWESSGSVRDMIVAYFAAHSPVEPEVTDNWRITGVDLGWDDPRRADLVSWINEGLLPVPYNQSYNLADYDSLAALAEENRNAAAQDEDESYER